MAVAHTAALCCLVMLSAGVPLDVVLEVLGDVTHGLDRAVLHGSDGSRAFAKFHAHFTINANGKTTVQLETDRLVCT